MNKEQLGHFQVLVNGGGIPGALEAVRQSTMGRSVAIIEERASLLWQVTRAKQNHWVIPDSTVPSNLHSLHRILQQYHAVSSDQLEPVYTEAAADQWTKSNGIKVLYHAKLLGEHGPAPSNGKEVLIALKGKIGTMQVDEMIDCREKVHAGCRIDCGLYPWSIWTLTLFDCPVPHAEHIELDLNGQLTPVRLRNGFHEGDTYADVAFATPANSGKPLELMFAQSLEAIILGIRANRDEWKEAKLAHLCDEPWIPARVPGNGGELSEKLWGELTKQFKTLFLPV